MNITTIGVIVTVSDCTACHGPHDGQVAEKLPAPQTISDAPGEAPKERKFRFYCFTARKDVYL